MIETYGELFPLESEKKSIKSGTPEGQNKEPKPRQEVSVPLSQRLCDSLRGSRPRGIRFGSRR